MYSGHTSLPSAHHPAAHHLPKTRAARPIYRPDHRLTPLRPAFTPKTAPPTTTNPNNQPPPQIFPSNLS